MKYKLTAMLSTVVLALGFSTIASATLNDRGSGMIYDSDQDITWLADANYAKTSGHDADGIMNWGAATAWADGLNFGGYDDWRLPTVTDTGTSGCNNTNSGTDCGYNVDTTTGELAYLFHSILGNESWLNPDGSRNTTGCPGTNPMCVQSISADGVNVLNLQSFIYWSGTEYAPDPNNRAWILRTDVGSQHAGLKGHEFCAWAVRSGDVAVVPELTTVSLFGLGLLGVLGRVATKRRRC